MLTEQLLSLKEFYKFKLLKKETSPDYAWPSAFKVAADGSLLLVSQQNHQCCRLNSELELISKIGQKGKEPGAFWFPGALEIFNGKIYVLDTGNERIQVFDLEGKFSYSIETLGKENVSFKKLGYFTAYQEWLCFSDYAAGTVYFLDEKDQVAFKVNVPRGESDREIAALRSTDDGNFFCALGKGQLFRLNDGRHFEKDVSFSLPSMECLSDFLFYKDSLFVIDQVKNNLYKWSRDGKYFQIQGGRHYFLKMQLVAPHFLYVISGDYKSGTIELYEV